MNSSSEEFSVFWFRRDLRIEDNHALFQALTSSLPVLPVFIFDTSILDKLSDRNDRRVQFIHVVLSQIHQRLQQIGTGIRFYHGSPEDVFSNLIVQGNLKSVYTNHDYEPYARDRDEKIGILLKKKRDPVSDV